MVQSSNRSFHHTANYVEDFPGVERGKHRVALALPATEGAGKRSCEASDDEDHEVLASRSTKGEASRIESMQPCALPADAKGLGRVEAVLSGVVATTRDVAGAVYQKQSIPGC